MLCDDTNNEDIKTLREQIKFIRFYQIDHKEFIPKVWAYKHFLPDNLDPWRPSFGEGPDLYAQNNSNIWKLKTKGCTKFANLDSITVVDYEVFQVVSHLQRNQFKRKTFD
ncbi:33958_t:CDS:2 [Gigaspora margarita]|uniref:33958_t:CDS:1 n=1 Tax=Gigaspora margarita TaxID=4874 RepID=A0ABN7UU66_GIGMA|nr:33958_t:CDS:2 [Gigaspora margarita]